MDEDCVFCRIVAGEESAHVVHEDDETMAFLDINAAAEGHTLVVPKAHHRSLTDLDGETTGRLFGTARTVATAIEDSIEPHGLSLFQSNGVAAGQDVFHVHVHLLPRWNDDSFGFAPSRERLDPETGDRIAGDIRDAL